MKRGRIPALLAAALSLTVFAVGAPAALADGQASSTTTSSVITPLDATGQKNDRLARRVTPADQHHFFTRTQTGLDG